MHNSSRKAIHRWCRLVVTAGLFVLSSASQTFADNEVWTNLGNGMNADTPVIVFDAAKSNLYAGGYFTNAGGYAANYVARWNGTAWTNLGSGLNAAVTDMVPGTNGYLYVAGSFTTAGGVSATNVALWDENAWTNLGMGLMGGGQCLALDTNGNLYAGGGFTIAGGIPANRIALWNGNVWTNLGVGMDDGQVFALAIASNGLVYAGGDFTMSGGLIVNRIAVWNGIAWTNMGSGASGPVYDITITSNGNLYCAGLFTNINGIAANQIARWNGVSWTNLGNGMDYTVYTVAEGNNGNLYAGGQFTNAGGISANGIALWNGVTWTNLGSGIIDWVHSIAFGADNGIYVSGNFTNAGGVAANFVAKWISYMPSLVNLAASGITTNSATLNGNLISGGGTNGAYISIYRGLSDGGTNAGSWTTNTYLGWRTTGTFSTNITGLTSNTTYYCRCFASNTYGKVWATNTTNFHTYTDSDGDGMPDSWEIMYFGSTNAINGGPNEDYDGDGLSNLREYQNGTNPTLADTDGEGFSDYVEFINGTNPNNPGSYPTLPYKQWTRIWGSTNFDLGGEASVDSSGNVYVAGYTTLGGSFDGQTNTGGTDICLTKFNSIGNKQWTRIWGSSTSDYGYASSVDSSGNIYVAGPTRGSFDGQTNKGSEDIFLTKFDSAGSKQWTRIWGSSSIDNGQGSCVDSIGNVYVVGQTSGSFDGQTNKGAFDFCVTKFDGAGTKQWTRIWGSSGNECGFASSADSSGNVYVTGLTDGSFDGQANAGGDDIFLTKFDGAGTKQWTRIWGSSTDEYSYASSVDSSGNIYVAGFTYGSFDGQTNVGGKDLCLTKFDSAGTKQWSRIWGSSLTDTGYGSSVDSNGNVYVAGDTSGSFDGQTNKGVSDLCMTKFDSAGTKQWTRIWGGSNGDYGKSVSVDPSGNIYVAGSSGPFDGQTNAGMSDLCLTKWMEPLPVVVNLSASGITTNSATLKGNLLSSEVTNGANITIYWGVSDGNTNAGSWAANSYLGWRGAGPFSTNITGLASNTIFYYRCFASNIFGIAWAASTTNFHTDTDSDGDGIPDSWEIIWFSNTTTANTTSDYDHDEMPDWKEYICDTDPTISNSCFRIVVLSNQGTTNVVYFSSSSNRQYSLARCFDLLTGTWQVVEGQSNITGHGAGDWLTDTNPPDRVFYRVRVLLP